MINSLVIAEHVTEMSLLITTCDVLHCRSDLKWLITSVVLEIYIYNFLNEFLKKYFLLDFWSV